MGDETWRTILFSRATRFRCMLARPEATIVIRFTSILIMLILVTLTSRCLWKRSRDRSVSSNVLSPAITETTETNCSLTEAAYTNIGVGEYVNADGKKVVFPSALGPYTDDAR